MLLLMLFCKRILIHREDKPRYGKTINNSFLGTICSNIFCKNCLFKNILIHLSTRAEGKEFFFNTALAKLGPKGETHGYPINLLINNTIKQKIVVEIFG